MPTVNVTTLSVEEKRAIEATATATGLKQGEVVRRGYLLGNEFAIRYMHHNGRPITFGEAYAVVFPSTAEERAVTYHISRFASRLIESEAFIVAVHESAACPEHLRAEADKLMQDGPWKDERA